MRGGIPLQVRWLRARAASSPRTGRAPHLSQNADTAVGGAKVEDAELRKWCRRYDRDMPGDVAEEKRLSGLIRSKGFMTKSVLSDTMKWKFEGMGHALPTQLRHVQGTDAEVIEETTRRALGPGLTDLLRT